MFATHDDVLNWARVVVYEIGFVVVIIRSDTNTGMRGRTSFVVISCEESGWYRARKKDFVPCISAHGVLMFLHTYTTFF